MTIHKRCNPVALCMTSNQLTGQSSNYPVVITTWWTLGRDIVSFPSFSLSGTSEVSLFPSSYEPSSVLQESCNSQEIATALVYIQVHIQKSPGIHLSIIMKVTPDKLIPNIELKSGGLKFFSRIRNKIKSLILKVV